MPKVPKEVYENGVLLYTIVNYSWIDPQSKTAKILKPGWFPIKVFNYNHPRMRKKLDKLKKECEEIEARKNVDWDALSRFVITI